MGAKILLPEDIWPDRYFHDLDDFSFGVWNMNSGGGRFFKANRKWISTNAKLDLLKDAGVGFVEAHDSDILDMVLGEKAGEIVGYPENLTEPEKMDLLVEAATDFKDELKKRDLKCGAFTMNLFNSEREWNFGNYGSEIDEVRQLAIQRTLAGIEIAVEILDAQIYIYWVGTNGTDGLLSTFHPRRIRRTREALIEIMDKALTKHGDKMCPFAFEPKPEEPKFKMYYGTAASALACVFRITLEHPELGKYMGLNIEVAHSLMGKTDPAMDYGEALESGKLFHIHENAQGEPAYDRDLAAGDDSLVSLIDRMWQLKVGNYKGLLGADVQPLPQDRDDQMAATIQRTIRRVSWAVEKARKLDDSTMEKLHSKHDQAGVLEYLDQTVFSMMN
jgi:xylose isomerase